MSWKCPKCGSRRPRANTSGNTKPVDKLNASTLGDLCGPCYIAEKRRRRNTR